MTVEDSLLNNIPNEKLPQEQEKEKRPASPSTGIGLLRAAFAITNDTQPDAFPAQARSMSSTAPLESAAPPAAELLPLSPSKDEGNKVRTAEPSANQGKACTNVEENVDPNTEAMRTETDADSVKVKANHAGKTAPCATVEKNTQPSIQRVKPPPTAKGPPGNSAETLQKMADSILATMGNKQSNEPVLRGSTPRLPPNSWYDKTQRVDSPDETWMLLDGLRVRMEMLPGGLVIERDTNLTDLAVLMSEMQNGEVEASEEVSQSQASQKHAEVLADASRLSELVEAVESEYWRWCMDADAPPVDTVAKQQVHDWLVHTGEKAVVLTQLRELGARRCIGTGNPSVDVPGDRPPCRKFLQYGLYKSRVRRCPTCSKESKRLVALCATEAVRCSLADAAVASSEGDAKKSPKITFSEGPPSSIEVQARELAWAPYAGVPNTYFRAYVLPSDLEIAKENGTPVMVNWLDGDRRCRSVPARDVVMADHPWASDLKSANSANWSNESQRLVSTAAGH